MNLHVSASTEMAPHATVIRSFLAARQPEHEALTPVALWRELASGRIRIVRHGVDDAEAWLELEPRRSDAHRSVTPTQAHITERVLAGRAQKTFIYDLQLSASTVSMNCSQALRQFGVDCSVRRAPLALAMVAVAHRLQPTLSLPGYRVVPGAEAGRFEVRMSRPEGALRSLVTPAEYDTLRGVISGLSHKQVSAARECSARTIANQLRSAACKLSACSRLQVVRLALQRLNGVGATAEI